MKVKPTKVFPGGGVMVWQSTEEGAPELPVLIHVDVWRNDRAHPGRSRCRGRAADGEGPMREPAKSRSSIFQKPLENLTS